MRREIGVASDENEFIDCRRRHRRARFPGASRGTGMAPAGARRERSVVFVGTERGIETRLVPQAGLPLETIRAAGLKGMGGKKLLRNAAMLPAGLWDSEKILRRHHFDVALGVGGYASGPMMFLGADAPHSHVVFEPNVEPGFTNRILAGSRDAWRR